MISSVPQSGCALPRKNSRRSTEESTCAGFQQGNQPTVPVLGAGGTPFLTSTGTPPPGPGAGTVPVSSVPQLCLSLECDSESEEVEKKSAVVSATSSVSARKKQKLRECMKCGRKAEVDCEVGQCIRCNADEIHECTRRVLVEQLPPAQAWAYANEAERAELALILDPDEPCLQLGRVK